MAGWAGATLPSTVTRLTVGAATVKAGVAPRLAAGVPPGVVGLGVKLTRRPLGGAAALHAASPTVMNTSKTIRPSVVDTQVLLWLDQCGDTRVRLGPWLGGSMTRAQDRGPPGNRWSTRGDRRPAPAKTLPR